MSVENMPTEKNKIRKHTLCRWCGSETYDGIAKDGSGFWCAYCDGFTYFDEKMNEQHRMLLILEAESGKDPRADKVRGLSKRISPLRYPGGKSKLVEYTLLNSQPWQMDTFVEVFAGGASVGLSLLDASRIDRLILNDADTDVYTFWKIVLNDPDYLTGKIENTAPTRDLFFQGKRKIERGYPGKRKSMVLLFRKPDCLLRNTDGESDGRYYMQMEPGKVVGTDT